MNSLNILETKNKNKYLYDQRLKIFHLCHPLFHFILKKSREIDIKNWIKNLKNDSKVVEIEGYGSFKKKDVKYYFQKYMFLKDNGYFTEIDQEKRLSRTFDAEKIKGNLANVGHVVFEVTEHCNLNCKYCIYGGFYNVNNERKKRDLDIQLAKNFLNYLTELWNSTLNTSHGKSIHISFYGGEPLLNFTFISEIVDYIKHELKLLHNHFVFSMTTNGTLLHKHMDFLYENNFEILISLDGNEQNNAYRVFKEKKPSFHTIMHNIDLLRKKYSDYFMKNVDFIAVFHNKNTMSDIYRFFEEHFDKSPHIIGLNTFGLKNSEKKEFWKTYANINQSLYESEDYSVIEKNMFFSLPNIKDLMRFLYCCNNFCFVSYNQLLSDTEEEKQFPTGTCMPFHYKIFVSAKGKILPCERIGHQFGLGYISQENIKLDFDRIAQTYNRLYNKMKKQCTICHNVPMCGQCIFNIDTIENEDSVCNGLMTETDFAKYISSFLSYLEEKPKYYSQILREVKFD